MTTKLTPEQEAAAAEGAPENLADGQTMEGFEDGEPMFDGDAPEQQPPEDPGEQSSYLPPAVPDGHLAPPLVETFANATYLRAGEQFKAIVRSALELDEFQPLAGIPYEVLWRRKTKPWLNVRTLDEDEERPPLLATCTLTDEMLVWWSNQIEQPVPKFFVNLHWQHFEDLRNPKRDGGGNYYHREIIAMHVHWALSELGLRGGQLKKLPPEVLLPSVETLRKYGLMTEGLRRVQQPMLPWIEEGALKSPGFDETATE